MSDRLLKFIAWWQIICGVLGVGLFAAYYLDLFPNGRNLLEHQIGWVNYCAGVAFFSFAVAAGRSLLKNEVWGFWASFVCQAVQIVSVAVLRGPQVQISAGPFLGVKVSDTQFLFSAGFNSTFFLGTMVSGPAFLITVNALALAWAMGLLYEGIRRARPEPQ